MFNIFTGQTANEVWGQATLKLLEMKNNTIDSRGGDTVELLHTLIHIDDPTQRWVTQRTPPISIGFALAELIWILAGSNDAEVINYWNPALTKFSGKGKYYHGAYGYRIKHVFGFDQLEYAYYALSKNSNSRQVVIQIWDPRIDFPDKCGKAINNDIPCNICSLLKVRDNKLEWTQIMRSNDIYLGLPYNFIQFTSLQEILAGWLGLETGSYCHYSDSLHLYHDDIKDIGISNDVNLKNKDSLIVEKEECYSIVNQIYRNMTEISLQDIDMDRLFELSFIDTHNSSYQNIMYIIALYAAHKKGFNKLESELENRCTNDLYLYLWNVWKSK